MAFSFTNSNGAGGGQAGGQAAGLNVQTGPGLEDIQTEVCTTKFQHILSTTNM